MQWLAEQGMVSHAFETHAENTSQGTAPAQLSLTAVDSR